MNESILQKQAEIQGLATAILLPSVGLFGGPAESRTDSVGPLTSIVGVGLFQRTVLTLQRAGIRQLIVLAGPEEDQLKQTLGGGPRLTIPVRWMPIREFPLDDPRTWEFLAAEVRGFALLASVNAVFSRTLIEQLRREVQDGQAIVVAQARRAGNPMAGGLGLKVSADRLTAFTPANCDDPALSAADIAVLPASFMNVSIRTVDDDGRLPVRRWLEHAATDGHVRVLTAEEKQGTWYQEVRVASDVPAAEKKLFHSLKGEAEGFVDRYFNRKLSRWFTRIFLAAGFSPNAVTGVASLIGFASAAGFALGTYTAGIAAALVFQLAAVIDCCDGEVARLTFTESPFGAWLDIAMDNIVHMAIFAGIAVGLYMAQVGESGAWQTLAFGAVAVLGNGLSFLLVERTQKIKATNRWRTPEHAAWADFMLKNVASRDFSVFLVLFAVFGMLHWFLLFTAFGALIFAGVMVWVVRPSAVTATTS